MALQPTTGPALPREGPASILYVSSLLDAAAEKIAFILRVPKTGTLHSVGFRLTTVTQAPANGLKVSFQDVSLATGDPDGAIDQYRVVVGGLTTNAWVDVSATGPITSDGSDGGSKRSVTLGDYLAVVIEFANFSAGDSLNVGASYVVLNAFGNHYVDYYLASWTKQTSILITVALKYDDGTYAYIPASAPYKNASSTALNISTTPDEIALKFKMPYPVKVNRLSGRFIVNSAAADFQLVLYDSDGSTVLASAALDASVCPGAAGAYFHSIPIPEVTLNKDTYYYVALKPTTVNNLEIYWHEVAAVAVWDQVDQGQNFFWSQRTDAGAWTDTTTKRPTLGVFISALDDGVGGGGAGISRGRVQGGM